MTSGNHALVFGASGITGWAIVNEILKGYPTPDAFATVTAFTNRPLSAQAASWPESDKLHLVSGIDLVKNEPEELEKLLIQHVPSISKVTVVYFAAYIQDYQHPDREVQLNVGILKKTTMAVQKLSPALRFVLLPMGARYYGIEILDQFPYADRLPLKESLPRVPEPHASSLFYYHQADLLQSLSKNQSWTYCDVRPDVIVGYVPNNNAQCVAQELAVYLSLYREIHGEGAEVVFGGTAKSWSILSNDSNQDIIARFAIHASLNPELSAEQGFNVADNAKPSSWAVKWPVICSYFGLKGVPPTPISGSASSSSNPGEFIRQHAEQWRAMEEKYSLRQGHVLGNDRAVADLSYGLMQYMDFDRQLDMTKTHRAWGDAKEEFDDRQSWYTAFDRFRAARIIP